MPNPVEVVSEALRTQHNGANGIGSLGVVVAHNLAVEAVAALRAAGYELPSTEPVDPRPLEAARQRVIDLGGLDPDRGRESVESGPNG